jgi:hypothetical protein
MIKSFLDEIVGFFNKKKVRNYRIFFKKINNR